MSQDVQAGAAGEEIVHGCLWLVIAEHTFWGMLEPMPREPPRPYNHPEMHKFSSSTSKSVARRRIRLPVRRPTTQHDNRPIREPHLANHLPDLDVLPVCHIVAPHKRYWISWPIWCSRFHMRFWASQTPPNFILLGVTCVARICVTPRYQIRLYIHD
jgi:hypothetical protein